LPLDFQAVSSTLQPDPIPITRASAFTWAFDPVTSPMEEKREVITPLLLYWANQSNNLGDASTYNLGDESLAKAAVNS
jgi:hypothetical protein